MTVSRRGFLKVGGAVMAGVGLGGLELLQASKVHAQTEISPTIHLLRRITWGVRSSDISPVELLGASDYIEYQLAYEAIPDPLVDDFIVQRRVFSMPIDELRLTADDRYEVVHQALLWSRLYRAIFSERQLYEMMVELWTDHLNIPAPDYLADKLTDDRDVVRKHALGNFRDLILASAQSPAMLKYLDNAVSTKEQPNENYARELMELHTLGVDGGYTEQDVAEVARAFTGWTLTDNYYTASFTFSFDQHDTDEKTVLGVRLPAGRGIEDGLQVIDILVNHPSTARFVAKKLCRKFITDFPPEGIIQSTAEAFTSSKGDIKATLRHLFGTPEFWASSGQKFRRPMDFLVAMIRALHPSIRIENPDPLFHYALEPMGHMPFYWFPPNGYPDVAGAWMNTNGLLYRWNSALLISSAGDGYFSGLTLNLDTLIPMVNTVGELVDATTDAFLHHSIASSERDKLLQFVSRAGDPNETVTANLRNSKLPSLVGLVFASPYFQWR